MVRFFHRILQKDGEACKKWLTNCPIVSRVRINLDSRDPGCWIFFSPRTESGELTACLPGRERNRKITQVFICNVVHFNLLAARLRPRSLKVGMLSSFPTIISLYSLAVYAYSSLTFFRFFFHNELITVAGRFAPRPEGKWAESEKRYTRAMNVSGIIFITRWTLDEE